MPLDHELIHYIRIGAKIEKANKVKVGKRKKGLIVFGRNEIGDLVFGWSLCHSYEPEFDKDLAFRIARNRTKYEIDTNSIPQTVKGEIAKLMPRIEKYYKELLVY